jgi:hypothetical protein
MEHQGIMQMGAEHVYGVGAAGPPPPPVMGTVTVCGSDSHLAMAAAWRVHARTGSRPLYGFGSSLLCAETLSSCLYTTPICAPAARPLAPARLPHCPTRTQQLCSVCTHTYVRDSINHDTHLEIHES